MELFLFWSPFALCFTGFVVITWRCLTFRDYFDRLDDKGE